MSKNSQLQSIAQGTSITLTGTVLGLAIKFASRVLFARGLGSEQYGMLMLGVTLLYLLNSVSGLGMNVSLARFIPYFESRGDEARLKGTIQGTVLLVAAASIVVGGVALGTSRWISAQFFDSPDGELIVKAFAVVLPIFSMGMVLRGGLRGFRQMAYIEYADRGVRQIGLFALAVTVTYFNLSVLAVSVGYGIVFTITTLFFAVLLWYSSPFFRSWNEIVAKYEFSELFSFSWPIIASQQFSHSRKRADTLLVGYFTTNSLVGIYNVALPLARLIQVGLSSINRILMPSVTTLYAEGKLDELCSTYRLAARWTFFLTFPAYLVLVINAEAVLYLTFGEEYLSAEPALIILVTGFLINAISGSFGEMLITIGKTRVNMWASIAALALNLILNILLIPHFDIIGASVASAVSLMSVAAIGGGYLYSHLGVQPFGTQHTKALVASIPPTAFLILIDSHLSLPWEAAVIPFCTIAAYAVFAGGLIFLRAFTAEEIDLAKNVYTEIMPIRG